jgi:hypothetical protein
MPSMFKLTHVESLIERIAKLSPDTKAQWGTMHVDQMLAHCQQPLRVALGELKPKRTFLGLLVGPLVKKKLTSGKPWGKGLPTDKDFLIIDRRKFADEQRRLSGAIRRFNAGGPEGLTKWPHPFFGKLTANEWDKLTCNHLDHHLRQFGV